MTELQSCELDCTTNLRHIYDRLPGHLQGKWRKAAMSYRERSGGREPDLKELSKFVTAQSQIENDPVYGRKGESQTRFSVSKNTNKRAPEERASPTIPTLATEVQTRENRGNQEARKSVTPREQGRNGSSRNQGEYCKVCKGAHVILNCSVFLSKSVGWRRRFARFKALCYRCLSHTHLQKNCPEKTGCTEKDCTRPQDHHSLLHVSTKNEIEDVRANDEPSSPAIPNLSVNNATTENNRRSFVLLKVVPLRLISENGRTLTTYGMLDSAAVSSMITSNIAEKLGLQGVPEKVSISNVTQRDQNLELSKVKFQISSVSQGSPSFPVYHALTVKGLNVSDRYCPSQLDLSPWSHLSGLQLPNAAVDVNEVSVLVGKGNFRLTKFISNDKDVLAAIPAEERTIKNLDLDKLPIERALGQQWNIDTDTFSVKTSLPSGRPGNDTRRRCLAILSSIFDPLGMIGPVLLPAKRVLQRTWQLKLRWDDKLPEELLKDWNKWKEDLTLLNHVSVPRCYFPGGCSLDATFQLHHFSDASEVGYGTVSYLRRETEDGRVDSSLVMAKSRTTPLQFVSVPRLELQAATIAVRMHRLILKEIDLAISASFFWTDSKITLQYINNGTRRFETYVANRVAEIRDASQPGQWRHCPGSLNPADEASRGIRAQRLLTSERWFKGPAFRMKPEEDWPCFEIEALPEDDQEIKDERAIFILTLPEKLTELLVKYSSWTVLQRKIAWLLKFKAYLQYRKDKKADIEKNLTTADLEKATLTIVKLVQREVYAEEIQDLKTKGHVKRSSKIVKLRPILDDGVMRVGGRIAEAPIAFDAKFPMIVPPKHHVAQLLIASFHQKLLHAGQNHILAHLREKFWIPNGRSAVRKVVRSCITCKKQRTATMEQMMSALPAFRTAAYEPCFTYTGVDYFGPLNIKKGRSVVKRWGAIFTRMNSRAVHLELATSLESDCFINVFRRFVNRRGPPKFMYSDNGTNFVGAEREIRQAIENWNKRQIKDELLQRGCQWVFQPPKASHASGVRERLIRSTRTALKATLGESLVEEDVLATVLTEVEATLNSRPLCAISDDPNDLQPLTPNHLLLQRTVSTLPPGTFVKEDILLRKK
ncbi:uncharacterized protein [Acropora muricata]|uniref:uncharacterized protein n=1 Tax=Acropora muricata TaxID=159855 RepID=UPI0034E5DAB0